MGWVVAYLLIGFAAGIAILKWPSARYESPSYTLFISMVAWPIGAALGLVGAIVTGTDAALRLIGIEAHPGDTHGV